MCKKTSKIYHSIDSHCRPAWTSGNLRAYRDKQSTVQGKFVVQKGFYEKTKGLKS